MAEIGGIRQGLARIGVSVIALLVAAITGCGVASVALAVIGLLLGLGGFGLGILIGLMTLPFWIGGLFLIGGPLWAVLHRAGRRDRVIALVAGGIAAAIFAPLILWALATDLRFYVDRDSVGLILLAGLPAAAGGAMAGFTVWRVGYDEKRAR